MTALSAPDFSKSYLRLRKFVGYIGLALPFVLLLGALFLPPYRFYGSISAYYYAPIFGNIFVGSMCAFGVFLLFYDFDRPNNIAGNVAGAAAIGVGVFPTTPEDIPRTLFSIATIHIICTIVFFGTLAFFCLYLFRLPKISATRNIIYISCGVLMVAALLCGLAAVPILGAETYSRLHFLFYCEMVAVLAFGVSWLVKGTTLGADPAVA